MRLGIVTTHPVQYYAPWFQRIAADAAFDLRVFYLWDFGVTQKVDPGFQRAFTWDVPLLEGYASEFVPNNASSPGTHHFRGISNPGLFARLEQFRPEALLVFGYNYLTLQNLIWRWHRSRAPLMFRGDSHHLLGESGARANLRRRLISAVYARFSAFLYVGQANRDYFTHHGVRPEQLFFAPHAVDNDRFIAAGAARDEAQAWRATLGIPTDATMVLFAGKLQEKKRPLDLLEAFLRIDDPSAFLVFVGDGELEPELRAKAGAHPRVRFAPFQNQSQMPRTYAACDVFVLPSFGRSETWGLAVNEAMCLERAIVVSSHVGCAADLVQHGRNGMVFPAGQVECLTIALRECFRDRERLRRWGQESGKIVRHYHYNESIKGLKAACSQLPKFV